MLMGNFVQQTCNVQAKLYTARYQNFTVGGCSFEFRNRVALQKLLFLGVLIILEVNFGGFPATE